MSEKPIVSLEEYRAEVVSQAEHDVIGGCLLEPEMVPLALGSLDPEDFDDTHLRHAFCAIRDLVDAGLPVGLIPVKDQLFRNGTFHDAGTLLDCMETFRSIHSGRYSIETVLRSGRHRRARERLHETGKQVATTHPEDAFDAILDARDGMDALVQQELGGTADLASLLETFRRGLKQGEPEDAVVPTGVQGIDRKLSGGLRSGNLVLLAGRPGHGKSSFATSVVGHLLPKGKSVLLFSLEVRQEDVIRNIIAGVGDVAVRKIRAGHSILTYEEQQRVEWAERQIEKGVAQINDKGSTTLPEILSTAKHHHHRHGLDLLVVDYLQLVTPPKAQNRNLEVAEMSRAFKMLARDLDVPCLILSQLSRAVELRPGDLPQLSDLRDSGSLEQDADIVLFVHRPNMKKVGASPADERVAQCRIAKNRAGPTGTVTLDFSPTTLRFTDKETP